MATFVTADDKRIYDLQSLVTLALNYSLPVDLAGNLAAKRVTLQQIIDYVSANGVKAKAYASTVNPDNAFGKDGDFHFTVPADGSRLQLWQRNATEWLSVFNLPISSKIALTGYTEADINADGYLIIKGADVANIEGKVLIGAYTGDEPVRGAYLLRANNTIEGFYGAVAPIVLYFN